MDKSKPDDKIPGQHDDKTKEIEEIDVAENEDFRVVVKTRKATPSDTNFDFFKWAAGAAAKRRPGEQVCYGETKIKNAKGVPSKAGTTSKSVTVNKVEPKKTITTVEVSLKQSAIANIGPGESVTVSGSIPMSIIKK